jgi:hypothetical protein
MARVDRVTWLHLDRHGGGWTEGMIRGKRIEL